MGLLNTVSKMVEVFEKNDFVKQDSGDDEFERVSLLVILFTSLITAKVMVFAG